MHTRPDRRRLLQAGALAGAGLLALPTATPALSLRGDLPAQPQDGLIPLHVEIVSSHVGHLRRGAVELLTAAGPVIAWSFGAEPAPWQAAAGKQQLWFGSRLEMRITVEDDDGEHQTVIWLPSEQTIRRVSLLPRRSAHPLRARAAKGRQPSLLLALSPGHVAD